MNKDMVYWNEVINRIQGAEELVIYGAGMMGKALKKCLTEEPYNKRISGFLVGSMNDNPDKIDGIPVFDIVHAKQYKNSMVLVALHEKHIDGAVASLQEAGFVDIVPISFDSDSWSDIRGNWFRLNKMKEDRVYTSLEEILQPDLHVYVVHSAYDRKLKEEIAYRNYEIPIQVGAALTEQKIFPVRDNIGENISDKNRQYCELTGLYWIWKHDCSKYVGMCHYRRKFMIEESQVERLIASSIDIVVTVPVLNFVSVRGQYCRDHEEKDWDIMLEAIKILHPEYVAAAQKVQDGIYYYAYNMFIARKEIFDKYCEWLFSILFYCEDKIGVKEDTYQNRYVGFLAERLLTVYLEHNKQYKLAIAKKHFIENE